MSPSEAIAADKIFADLFVEDDTLISNIISKRNRNMAKSKQPSRTSIGKTLGESVFDPRANGPLKIIADTGDAGYLITRAKEFLNEATQFKSPEEGPCIRDKLTTAISLLALAKLRA